MTTMDREQQENEMLALIEELVNIDSGTFDKEGVDRVGTVLAAHYRSLGFKVERDEQTERGDILVICHPEATEPQILILGHMDTVFPKGTAAARPFSRQDRKAFGPGVYDMKSSLATMLFAIRSLVEAGDDSYRNIKLLLNSDEEHGSIYSRERIEREAAGAKFALVVEPSDADGTLVTERRGGGKYELHVTGVAAHSGAEPEKGRSAIGELAHKIVKLHALTNPLAGIHVNVGVIEGGTSCNTIAAYAHALIDVRMDTVEQAEELDRRVRQVCSEADIAGTKLELKGGITRPPMVKTAESGRLLQIVQEEALLLGERLSDRKTGSGSDGNLTAAAGVATIDSLGPRGGNGHRADEYVLLDSLVPRAKLLANVIKRLRRL